MVAPVLADSTIDLEALARERCTVFKDEPQARVELLGAGPHAVVRKTYRNHGLRLLQSWWRRSRAEREFDNLRAVAAAGLPCTPPLIWSEHRRFGCVRSSTLVTGYVDAATTLKAALGLRPRLSPDLRRTLARDLGRLLAQLHDRGILWGTPMPRNVLVQGLEARPTLVLCDLPAAIRWPHAVATGPALLDLFDAVGSPSRRRDWSAGERFRCLLAYADGDRLRARHLWQLLGRRRRAVHRLRKNLLMAVRTYILARPPTEVRGATAR